jgi:hypothetical protein
MERVESNSYNILDSYYEKIKELDERFKYHIMGNMYRVLVGET